MPGVSPYERLLIESVLLSDRPTELEGGAGLFITPAGGDGKVVLDLAVLPAMRRNELDRVDLRVVFDDMSSLADVCQVLRTAEVVVADVSDLNPSVMFVIGLAHGLGRFPILLTRETAELPFNLRVLRGIEYANTKPGLFELRERLERVLRVFLLGARAPR